MLCSKSAQVRAITPPSLRTWRDDNARSHPRALRALYAFTKLSARRPASEANFLVFKMLTAESESRAWPLCKCYHTFLAAFAAQKAEELGACRKVSREEVAPAR